MQTTQNTQPPHTEAYEPDNEINLLDLLLVLLKHKKLIFWMVFITGVLAVFFSLRMPNIYRSEATLALRTDDNSSSTSIPGLGGFGGLVTGRFGIGGNKGLEKLKVTLNSRELTRRVVDKYNLMPVLFEHKWDSEKKDWIDKEKEPTIQDAWGLVLNSLLKVNINQDSSTIKVGFESKNPEFSQHVVEYYITELSNTLREEVLSDASEKKKFFNKQLESITDPLLREKIYALLAKEIERETFAKAQQYYGFLLIDPSVIPDADKKVRPRRSTICILSVFVAFFLSIFMAFIFEFTNRIKTEDQERFNALVKEIKFWKKI